MKDGPMRGSLGRVMNALIGLASTKGTTYPTREVREEETGVRREGEGTGER